MRIHDHRQAAKVGEEYLGKIRSDVGNWHACHNDIAELREHIEDVNQRVKELVRPKIQGLIRSGMLNKDGVSAIASNFPLIGRGPFTISCVAAEVLASREVQQLLDGRSFMPNTGITPRVIGALTVSKPDVVRSYSRPSYLSSDVTGLSLEDLDQMEFLEQGTVLEGRVTSFASNPEIGGAIAIRPRFGKQNVICGLVSPMVYEPNVGLELLGL